MHYALRIMNYFVPLHRIIEKNNNNGYTTGANCLAGLDESIGYTIYHLGTLFLSRL
jgi:hypothetical protein